jgi:hypothetical protein
MNINRLEFQEFISDNSLTLGGSPYIMESQIWPLIPGTSLKQTLLLTIFPAYFKIPLIPADCCISVFTSIDQNQNYGEQFACHQTNEITLLKKKYTSVILHKKSPQRLISDNKSFALPLKSIVEIPFTSEEFKMDTIGLLKGSELSKTGGQPGWLQNFVAIGPQYVFELQINEYDLRKISPEFDGIFNDGIGYLFLTLNTKKIIPPKEAGLFFIQYT